LPGGIIRVAYVVFKGFIFFTGVIDFKNFIGYDPVVGSRGDPARPIAAGGRAPETRSPDR
jgi:hypothetical protein